MIIIGEEKPSLEDLMHHGVKGMKWGVVRNLQRNHTLNKASRQRDRAAIKTHNAKIDANQNKAIDKARERVNSGKTDAAFKSAKAAFKTDKKTIGSREARKKLNIARGKRDGDYETASMVKSGRETTISILASLGGVAIGTGASVALANRGLMNR